MRVAVDRERCEGNGKCQAAAGQVFALDDQDLAYVLLDEVPPGLAAAVEQAIRVCPRQAIAWVDAPS